MTNSKDFIIHNNSVDETSSETNAPCLWNLHVITVHVSLYIHKIVG